MVDTTPTPRSPTPIPRYAARPRYRRPVPPQSPLPPQSPTTPQVPPQSPVQYRYVEDVQTSGKEFLMCSICHSPMMDPVLLPACGHTYCRACITTWLGEQDRCPYCSKAVGDITN